MKPRIPIRSQDAILAGIRMFAEELDAIKTAAKQANLSLSEFVRNKLLAGLSPINSHSILNSSLQDSLVLSENQSNQNFQENQHSSEKTAASLDSDVARKSSHI